MKVSLGNTASFRSSNVNDYVCELPSGEDAQRMADAVKSLQDNLNLTNKDNYQPKKKGFFGVMTSIAVAFGVTFLLSKKICKVGSAIKNKLLKNEKIKDFATSLQKTISEKLSKSEKLTSLKNSKIVKHIVDFVKTAKNKLGTENLVAGAGALAGTAYIAKADTNGDGVADVAQKGVNVYKGIISKMGPVGDAISALS